MGIESTPISVITLKGEGILKIENASWYGITVGQDVAVKDVYLFITSSGMGLSADGNIEVSDGYIDSSCKNSALFAEGNITVKNGSTIIAASDEAEGIFTKGKLSVSGSNTAVSAGGAEGKAAVTALGGIEINEPIGIAAPNGGKLSADGTTIIDREDKPAQSVSIEVPDAGTPGDVNGDGVVDAKDLTALARHVARIEAITDETLLKNADVTGEGDVTAADLTKLARFVARIINTLD